MEQNDQNRDGSGDTVVQSVSETVKKDDIEESNVQQRVVISTAADLSAPGESGDVGADENWPTAEPVSERPNAVTDSDTPVVEPTNSSAAQDSVLTTEPFCGKQMTAPDIESDELKLDKVDNDIQTTKSESPLTLLQTAQAQNTGDTVSTTAVLEDADLATDKPEEMCVKVKAHSVVTETNAPKLPCTSENTESETDPVIRHLESPTIETGTDDKENGQHQRPGEAVTDTQHTSDIHIDISVENTSANVINESESSENVISEIKLSDISHLQSENDSEKQMEDVLSINTAYEDSCMGAESVRSEDTRLSPTEPLDMSSTKPKKITTIPPVEGCLDENSSAACDTEMMETIGGGKSADSTENPVDKVVEAEAEIPMEESNDATSHASTTNSRKRHGSGSSITTYEEAETHGALPAANLFEYQWPQETGAEWYMLQEQISEFLTIKSFKRKYPELQRRPVEMNEKVFLRDRGVVSETQCDLGLMALKSEEVLDLMIRDYPMRYREYAAVLQEKERQTISEKHKKYDVPKFEKSKLADYMKKAVKSAAEFNLQFQRERREDRRAYFDLQTMAIHYPQSKHKVAPPEATKVGSYPVALIPGQFQDYYKQYTPGELRYFPVGTAVYGPPKKFHDILVPPSTGDTSEDSADDSAEDPDGSDSNSDDGDSSDGESVCVAPLSAPPPDPVVLDTPTNNKTPRPKREKRDEKEAEKTCRICKTDDSTKGRPEDLIQCSECKTSGHAVCLELTTEMIAVIRTYPWQCMECKTCVECMDPYDEDKMMFCDRCDRGYHTFCVGVKSIPTGRWECPSCRDMPSKSKKSRRQTRQNGVPSPKPAIASL